jgi:hypothetical protein
MIPHSAMVAEPAEQSEWESILPQLPIRPHNYPFN